MKITIYSDNMRFSAERETTEPLQKAFIRMTNSQTGKITTIGEWQHPTIKLNPNFVLTAKRLIGITSLIERLDMIYEEEIIEKYEEL